MQGLGFRVEGLGLRVEGICSMRLDSRERAGLSRLQLFPMLSRKIVNSK